MTTSDYNTIIADLLAADLDRDSIIIQLVTDHSVSINKATKLYGDYARENGLTAAIVSHKEDALALLKRTYSKKQWTAEAVKDAVIDLQELYGVAESTARDYCKAYSKALGVALPIVDPRHAIFNWFIAHDGTADKAEFIEFAVTELGRSKSNANEYWKGYELHLVLVTASK